jgi:benzoyl-CoA reductase/2-hydroxyglutaryl-CoA dehydratase subunit BcrC/BadD/HgdB
MSLTARGDELVRRVRDYKAKGVIFLFLKFCDPHSFDYPSLKERLDAEGVPSLLLEIEEQLPPEGQLRTRLETFISTL